MVNSLGKRRPFHDGCGLCSQGRWEPHRRICRRPSFVMAVRSRLLKFLTLHFDLKDLVIRMTLGRYEETPFDDK
eukprot:2758740-Karenia_brevis.AAC.1